MPFGRQQSMHTARCVDASSIGGCCAWAASTRTDTSGSAAAYSCRSAASMSAIAACAAAASATAMTARLSRGMALSFRPPATETSRSGVRAPTAYSTRPMRRFALPRPLSISAPEWPPSRPPTVTVSAVPENGARVTGSVHTDTLPPAQLTVSTPSSSESRLSIVRPFSTEASSAAAPSMPVSSSTVMTTSSGGWGMSPAARIASAMATAMPSSPPSVVPRAPIVSPSTKRSSPSRAMSFVQSGAVSQTMSMCPCRMTGAAVSYPGVPGAKMMTLLCAS